HGVPAGWQAQAKVETLGIDGFDLPRPCIPAGFAVPAGKSSHARQRHCEKLSVRRMNGISLNLATAATCLKPHGRQPAHKRRPTTLPAVGATLVVAPESASNLEPSITSAGKGATTRVAPTLATLANPRLKPATPVNVAASAGAPGAQARDDGRWKLP